MESVVGKETYSIKAGIILVVKHKAMFVRSSSLPLKIWKQIELFIRVNFFFGLPPFLLPRYHLSIWLVTQALLTFHSFSGHTSPCGLDYLYMPGQWIIDASMFAWTAIHRSAPNWIIEGSSPKAPGWTKSNKKHLLLYQRRLECDLRKPFLNKARSAQSSGRSAEIVCALNECVRELRWRASGLTNSCELTWLIRPRIQPWVTLIIELWMRLFPVLA